MSVDILTHLRDRNAFEPVPPRLELSDLHVKFDDFTNSSSCEAAASAALERGQRVALVGPSGAGKSSVIASVLDPLVEGLAPLPIPVSTSPGAIADGSTFVRHVIATVGRWIDISQPKEAAAANAVVSRSLDRTPRQRSLAVSFAPKWLFEGQTVGVDLRAELRSVTEATMVRPEEIFEYGRQILGLVRYAGLKSVLVLDDTDRWTNVSEGATRANRDRFFREIIRTIAEELEGSMVVAVHPTYLQDPAYLAAREGFLDATIDVPRLPDKGSLGQILALRATLALSNEGEVQADTSIEEIIEPQALDQLFLHYAGKGHSVRAAMQTAHASLTAAADEGAELITEGHIRAELDLA